MSVNLSVEVTDSSAEGITRALRAFKKLYINSVSSDVKRHEYALTRSQRRRLKVKRARKRERKQKHYWTASRIAYLDRHGLADDSSRTTPGRGGIGAASRVDPRGMASAATAG